ncbi:ATP-binding response regulator [Vibrio hippocampi]|uniref:Sensor histidine kinase RcsC n=1 Tax=Vibrio hippocampi TaxID=654686 RepID=A0ABM8ZHL3_9VIBR|nr:response regulator [Vibrio hippocampi]CAH0525769.1 Sensor histidine kinase RcsC [Vibrio hippocampi]
MSLSKPYFTFSLFRLCIALSVLFTLITAVLFFQWKAITPLETTNAHPLVRASKKLNEATSSVTLSIQDCLIANDCRFDPINSQLNNIKADLAQLIASASSDKSQLSLVGAVEYANLQLALSRYHRHSISLDSHRTLYDALVVANIRLQQNHQNLVLAILASELNQKQRYTYQLSLVIVGLIVTILATSRLYFRKISNINQNTFSESERIVTLSKHIEQMDPDQIRVQLNDTSLDSHMRRVYSLLKQIFEQLERQKQVSDLYKQLYALIGYEIRSITTTIKGGIQYLVQETDENGVLMAKDITSAANTLSELADNYNRLISKGGENEHAEFSLPNTLSELVIHLSSKASREQTRLECYIDSGIPNRTEGQSTRLFWILFLQMSSAMQVQSSQHRLFHVQSGAAHSVEKTRLTLSLYFLTTSNVSLTKLEQLHWSEHPNPPTSNEELAKTLLNEDSNFHIRWKQSGHQTCFQIELDLKVKGYLSDETELKDRKLLVLSDSPLQIDIISNTLAHTGATIEGVKSTNELFKLASNFKQYDAIFLTDTIENNKLPSLCKTVKSQLKNVPDTKLFISVSSAQLAQEAISYVDKIFYSPILGFEFIPTLATALDSESTEDNAQNSSFLIVEDDRVQQILLKRILTKQEYEPHVVSDGSIAVEHYKSSRSDIIFMDCIMPGMNGLEATKLIRTYEKQQDFIPCTIIGATALTSSQEHQACIEAGMDFVISKPYKNEEIIKVINKYVAVQKLN